MLGYNLLLDAPLDLPHLTTLNPGALVVVNGWERARDLKRALPNTLVIYRQWPDDNIHQRLSPQAWVDAHAAYGAGGIIVQADNEPNVANLPALAQWYAQVMDLAGQRGLAVAVGTFSTGNPHHERYHELEPMWRALDRWHDLHLWLPHEYFDVRVDTSRTWHIGRFQFGWQVCDRLGLRRPRTVIGELGVAQHMDAGRGWKAAGLSEDQYADELTKAARAYVDQGVLGACIFSLGRLGGWASFDVAGSTRLRERLITLSAGLKTPAQVQQQQELNSTTATTVTTATNPPQSTGANTDGSSSLSTLDGWRPVIASPRATYSRVRARPSVSAAEVGRIAAPTLVEIASASARPGEDDPAFLWIPLRSDSWAGWVREDVIRIEAIPTPPVTEPVATLQFPFWGSTTTAAALSQTIQRQPRAFSDFVATYPLLASPAPMPGNPASPADPTAPNVSALPMRGALFQRLPMSLDDVKWVQWFGSTAYAAQLRRQGVAWYRYSQNQHGGLDLGNSARAVPIVAGVNGVVDGLERNSSYYPPNFLRIIVGPYTLFYGHFADPRPFNRGDIVTPDTVIGTTELGGQNHLHLEVRYQGTWLVNPLHFLPDALCIALLQTFPPGASDFTLGSALDQPPIRLLTE